MYKRNTDRAPPTKNQCYVNALSAWVSCGGKEPQGVLKGSLLFLICCLPVVSYGPARLTAVYYMGRRCDGFYVTWREAAAFGFGAGGRGAGFKGWAMGLSDCFALLLAAGSGYAILEMSLPLPLRFIYCAVLLLDLIYLFSGIYRYPALAGEPENRVVMLMLRGFLLSVESPLWSFLFFSVQLLWLTACGLTGAGLPLLYPAGAALLSHCAYTRMIKRLLPVDNEN